MIINKDISKAIKKEEEYLYHKVELLDNTANIYEYLAEAGYDDINEFRNDAQEYYLHSQNMTLERVYITEESLNEWVNLSMSNTRLFRSSDIEDPSLDTVAIVGKDFNEHDKFIKEGVHPVVFNYMRGCIITGIEDFNFCLCLPKKNWLNLDKFILNKLTKFIIKPIKSNPEKLNKAYKDNQYLVNQLNGINNTFTRLNYLFKVLENSQHFNSDFIIKCADEIENTITVPEEIDTKDTEKN